jgi:hypothetical protein
VKKDGRAVHRKRGKKKEETKRGASLPLTEQQRK